MEPASLSRLTLDQLEQLGTKLHVGAVGSLLVTMPAAVSSWPGAHGHHLLVPLSLPTTEPLRVGAEPISSPCTQPLSYHVCAEIVHRRGFLVQGWEAQVLSLQAAPQNPSPSKLPLLRASHVIGNKSQECRGAPGACDSICLGSRNHHRHVWELAGGQDMSLRLPMGCGRLRR